jgi:hypothetical protein
VVCMDTPKQYVMMPCRHMCACEACARRLLNEGTHCCQVCRGPIEDTMRVFLSAAAANRAMPSLPSLSLPLWLLWRRWQETRRQSSSAVPICVSHARKQPRATR